MNALAWPRMWRSALAPATRRPLCTCSCPGRVAKPPSPRPPPPISRRHASSTAGAANSGLTLDEAIPHRRVALVCPTTKSLLPPASLSSLLAQLDRARFAIQLVDGSQTPPVCRIRDKQEEWNKAQAKKRRNKPAAAPAATASAASTGGVATGAAPPPKLQAGPPKEVALSWTMAFGDLSHKLGKAEEIARKVGRVKIVIGDPRGKGGIQAGGAVSAADRRALVAKVKEIMSEKEGVKETTRGLGTAPSGEVWMMYQLATLLKR